MSAPGGGGACSGVGGSGPGGWFVCSGGGVSGPGGGCLIRGVCIPACTEADTPPVESQTPVKTLPWPNFVAAGNYYHQRNKNI